MALDRRGEIRRVIPMDLLLLAVLFTTWARWDWQHGIRPWQRVRCWLTTKEQ